MKKSLIVAAVAATVANVAHAQSSAVLYGVLDAGVVYSNSQRGAANGANGASNFEVGSPVTGSYIGVRGVEDLGGGLAAVFQLENGFAAATGSGRDASLLRTTRPAFFGLRSEAGTVTLGRQYDSVVDYLAPLTLTGSTGGTLFGHFLDNDNANYGIATNNALKFTGAEFQGLRFGAMYGFSNQAGAFEKNRMYSLGMRYDNGPLKLGAAFLRASAGGQPQSGALPWNAVFNLTGGASIPGASVDRRDTYGLGGSYAVGPATVGLVWTRTRVDGAFAGFGNFGTRVAFDNYELNTRVQLAPAVSLAAAYTYTHRKDSAGNQSDEFDYHQFGLKADYALSKRTSLYAAGVSQVAPKDEHAAINGLPHSATNRQVALTTGLIHRF